MGPDQFTVEGPLAANALQAATVAPVAEEAWTDGSALLYSAADGKLHPVPVEPLAGAIVSVNAIPPLASSGGVAPIISFPGILAEAHGGFGADISAIGTGLVKRTGADTYTTEADSLTVSAGTGLSGGGSVALGGSTSLSLPSVGPGAGAIAYPASITLDAQGRVAAATAGSAPAALPLSRANGGLGSDISALSTGLLAQTASNTWAVRSVAQGTGITVTNGDGVSGNPTVAVDSSAVALLSGAQTFTGQKTFPSAGVSAVVIPAMRQTSGGNDITVPAASAPDSFALLAQSQALTNKTISGSSNTLSNIGNSSLTNSSVTVSAGTGLSGGGSVALGSSTSLSMPAVGTAGTYAYPTSVTTDDRGRVSAISAGSAPVIGGSAVMLAQVSTNGGAGWIFNGDYFGLSQMIESGRGTPTNVAPWVAPCAGTLKNFRTWTVAAAPSNSNFTVYQAKTSSTPTYNATSAVIAIASGAHLGADTTHTLTIAAGDLIIFKTDTSWTNPGFCIQAQFIPSTS